ncbi:MAG: methyltransferase domain-containing protein [Clostridia bacterium]|nr:methyltransferase domain-containing protein [Clostridia bacterium]
METWTEHLYYDALRCPVCGAVMERDEAVGTGQLKCRGPKTHCFDMARSGYVHLAPRHSGGGDSREAVRARAAFLSQNYYAVAARTLCQLLSEYVPSGLAVDAGCGEGYYTGHIARMGRYAVCGFDLSRDAVDTAARAARREQNGAHYAVASVFELPLADACTDAVVNIFAPCAETEFCRVLKRGGVLVLIGAGERHLLGLKRALYDETYENAERADLPKGMRLLERSTVRDKIRVEGQERIGHLFSMTPYYWRTSQEDRQKLQALDRLQTEIEFDCRVYIKE